MAARLPAPERVWRAPGTLAGAAATSSTSEGAYLGAGGIGVSDMQKSFDFYTGVFGLTQLEMVTTQQ